MIEIFEPTDEERGEDQPTRKEATLPCPDWLDVDMRHVSADLGMEYAKVMEIVVSETLSEEKVNVRKIMGNWVLRNLVQYGEEVPDPGSDRLPPKVQVSAPVRETYLPPPTGTLDPDRARRRRMAEERAKREGQS